MSMVAGAVVLNGGTPRASIRAEAVGLVLAFLLGLAQAGSTQGNLTEMTWGGEMGQRENRVPPYPQWDQSHFLHMTCLLPMNLCFSGSLLPQANFLRMTHGALHDTIFLQLLCSSVSLCCTLNSGRSVVP